MLAMTAVLAKTKAAYDMARAIASAPGAVREADLKLKIVDITEALADARSALLDAREEIDRLNARVRELERGDDPRSRVVEKDGVYWPREGTGGPYCPACLHASNTLMPLTKLPAEFSDFGGYTCPNGHGVVGQSRI
jgi:hypothetical protein